MNAVKVAEVRQANIGGGVKNTDIGRAMDDIRSRFRRDPYHVCPEIELSDLLDTAVIDALSDGADATAGRAVLAAGGYGRRTLHPASDLDFLILFGGDRDEGAVWSGFERIADQGFEVGYQAKSLGEFTVFDPGEVEGYTAFFEARYLWGDSLLAEEFTGRVFPDFVTAHRIELLEAMIASRAARLGKDSGPAGAPNVKTSVGGLRDYHFVCWVAMVLQIAVQPEVRRAATFLQRVRSVLHYVAERDHDALTLDRRAAVEAWLGYGPRRSGSPPEGQPASLMVGFRMASETIARAADEAQNRVRAMAR